MKKFKKHFRRLAAAGTAVLGSAGAALAEPATSIIDVSGMTPDITMVGTLGAAICGGLLGIWGVRKVIKLVNRS